MKKFLSLVLALVMTMSLVTISAGAKDFTDADDVTYVEAVDVLSAVKVVDGYTDGAFKPTTQLNRGQAAKILCNMILGPTTASALKADAAPFKDVAADNTFAAYIAYCAKEGIIDGYTDGTFRPTAPLTGYAFMKLLLGALGYDKDVEGYNGPNWSINVAKRALNIGLDDGLVEDFDGTKIVTREEACLFALNTLKADMVEYDTKTNISVGGAEVVIAGSKAKEVANNAKTETIFEDDTMQFAEKYFTNLKLVDGATDAFARPSNQWKLKAETIGTYAKTPDLTYTKSADSGDIYADLGLSSTIAKGKVTVYVDGAEDDTLAYAIKKGDDDNSFGANGVLTEVFYDDKADSVIITEVNTWVAEVSKTVAATSKKDAYVVIVPESVKPTGVSGNQEFETDEKFEDDAFVLYTYSQKDEEVKSLAVAEMVSGTATRTENKKANTDENKAIYIGDTAYKFSAQSDGVKLEDASVNNDYEVYLDAYGYAIYVKEIDEIGEYALVMSAQDKGDFSSNRALLVFADGTEKVVDTAKNYKVAAGNANSIQPGTIVTYKVDDGVYTLKPVAKTIGTNKVVDGTPSFSSDGENDDFALKTDKAGVVITKDNRDKYYSFAATSSAKSAAASETGAVTVNANSNTVFVVYNIHDDEYSVYTGVKNAPSVTATSAKPVEAYAYVKNGMTKVMFIFATDASNIEDSNNKLVFLAEESVSNLIHTTNSDYYEYNAVVNGEITTVKVDWNVEVDGSAKTSAQAKELNGLFASYSVDKYGVITRLTSHNPYTNGLKKTAINNADRDSATQVGIDKRSADYTVLLGTTKGVYKTYDRAITVDDAAKIYVVDEDGKITESAYKSISKDDDDLVYAVVEDYLVKYLFVEEVNPTIPYGVTMSITNGANGTVKVDGKTVADAAKIPTDKGDAVVISVAPNAGYRVKAGSFKVDGVAKTLTDGAYTIAKVTGVHTVAVEFEAIPAATMDVLVKFQLADGTPVDQKMISVAADVDGGVTKTYATIKAGTTVAGDVDVALPANFKLAATALNPQFVTFVADTAAQVTFVVERDTVTLSVPAGKQISWTAGLGYAAATNQTGTVTAPKGVTATVTLTSGTGIYAADGTAFTSESIVVGTNTISTTNYGRFEVVFTNDGNCSTWDMTSADFVTGTKAYVKNGDTVTITITGASGWATSNYLTVAGFTSSATTTSVPDDGVNGSITTTLTASSVSANVSAAQVNYTV